MLTNRLDSTRIARFVLRKVQSTHRKSSRSVEDSTHRKSICERLRKNTAGRLLTLGRVANVDESIRFDSNRAIRLA